MLDQQEISGVRTGYCQSHRDREHAPTPSIQKKSEALSATVAIDWMHLLRFALAIGTMGITISVLILLPSTPPPDCARWLADEVLIAPYEDVHLNSAHTFITADGEMLKNARFPEESKDACTKALHKHVSSDFAGAGRRLQNASSPPPAATSILPATTCRATDFIWDSSSEGNNVLKLCKPCTWSGVTYYTCSENDQTKWPPCGGKYCCWQYSECTGVNADEPAQEVCVSSYNVYDNDGPKYHTLSCQQKFYIATPEQSSSYGDSLD